MTPLMISRLPMPSGKERFRINLSHLSQGAKILMIIPPAQGRLLTLITLLSASLGGASLRADWPDFRGPNGQGIVQPQRPLPTHWSTQSAVRWRTELPGQGWSSPIVIGQRVLLTAAIESGAAAAAEDGEAPHQTTGPYDLALLILDANSGQLLRRVDLFHQPPDAPSIHQKNSHASPTPVFDGQHVLVHFGHQGTACTTLAGEIVWRNDSLAYQPVHGNGGTPLVTGDLLVFSRDGADISEVTALDKRTGQHRWSTPRQIEADKSFSFCTPLLIEVDGSDQLIIPGSNVVQSLRPQTGEEIWRVTYDGYSVIPRPVQAGDKVLICTGYNRPSLMAIDPTGRGDVTSTHVAWSVDTNVPHTPSLVAWDDRVAMISDRGIATCLRLNDGQTLWRQRVGGNFSASPLLNGDHLYLLSEDGQCSVWDVSQEPRQLARNEMAERALASLAVIEDDLLLRTDQAVYRIGR